uniref:non-specific protein-tyrosine kinase n=1 Tax=Anopheles dirus TaxID=7168 RepID=A0A182NHB5_9DIPT
MWNTAAAMEPKVPDLYEFLAEAELQQYYNSLKNELKITNVTHLKYATDEDLRQVSGLSRPEIRRLRKYYEKYYPHGYLNKIRRLLQTPRKDEPSASSPTSSGEIITVLDKSANTPYWKGVLNSGKTGLFNPANTVAYLDSLPSSVNRDSFCRTAERSSKRKIRTDMISRPQNDLKHTGHVGIDGVSFGDVAFLSSPQNLPRQIVTPYKPSEDLEQTPLLLPPTPTSPDSIQTASGYFSETLQLAGHQSFINAGENNHHTSIIDHSGTSTVDGGALTVSTFDFRNSGFKDSNPFINADDNGDSIAAYNNAVGGTASKEGQNQHEYHEISDDDMVAEKVFDQGPSLMDEMEHVFKSMSTISEQTVPLSPDAENANMRNELAELSLKMSRKNSSSTSSGTLGHKGSKSKSKKSNTVKPISMKDEKLLNQVIEMANEISAKSMTDLVTDANQQTSSPKRKFSFRFPHIHNVVGGDGLRGSANGSIAGSQAHASGMGGGSSSHAGRSLMQDKEHGVLSGHAGPNHPHSSNTLANTYREKRNFSQEVNNVPDLQRYRSLTGIESCQNSDIRIPLFDKESSDFCFKKSRELLSKQPFNMVNDMSTVQSVKLNGSRTLDKKTRDLIGENLLDIEKTLNALNLDFLQTYHELEKADSAETLFAECYSSMMCASSSPFQKSPPSGSLIRNSSIESSNSRINCALSEKGSSGSSSLTGKSPPTVSLGGSGGNGGNGVSRCYSELNGTSPKPALQQDHNNKYGIRDFKFRSFDARPKERSDYYNFKNEYLSELTRKQQSQVLGSASVLQQTAAAGSKQQQQHKINQLYQIYNTPMQGRKYEDSMSSSITATSSSAVRQRSLSFTDNYELRPSVTTATKSGTIVKTHSDTQQHAATAPPPPLSSRNVITYKPRSIRARNLRRLSYNPINMVDSSSSSSESELDRNLAHSECDIRTRLHTTATRRRRHQYMTRKSNSNSASSQDKLYGSNASIKSAPQYNYHSDRHQYYNNFHHPSYHYADDFGVADNDEEDESIFDYGMRHARSQSETKGTANALKQSVNAMVVAAAAAAAAPVAPATTTGSALIPATSPPGPLVGGGPTSYANKALEREYLYSEFDVSKLTGKSPTTQSYFPSATAPQPAAAPAALPVASKTTPGTPLAGTAPAAIGAHLQTQPQPGFQWPEKIHGAVVKHNDMLWRQQSAVQQQQQQPSVALYASVAQKERHYSSDTSSTETDSIDFRRPSTITEEARIAYNSLVENPCSSGAGASSIASSGCLGAASFACSTLPRAKLTNSLTLATASFRFKDIDCCSPPTEPAPKSPEATDLLLGGGGSAGVQAIGESSNPLRMMRNKNFPIVPRLKNKLGTQQIPWEEQSDAAAGTTNQAESPSYLTNPEYTYNNALTSTPTDVLEADGSSNNPIPLPPRDRNKTIPINQKRHVRKYPLIIPAAGLQRTLNKVTQVTPVDEKTDVFAITEAVAPPTVTSDHEQDDQHTDPDESSNLDVLHKSLESVKLNEIEDLPLNATEQLARKKGYSKEFLENNFPNPSSASFLALDGVEGAGDKRNSQLQSTSPTTTLPATIPAASAILTRRRTASDAGVLAAASSPRRQPPPPATLSLTTAPDVALGRDPTYENLDIFQTHNKFCIDTASLHCESILESDVESCPILGGVVAGCATLATDMVDGFNASALFDSISKPDSDTGRSTADKQQQLLQKTGPNDQPDHAQPLTDGELKKSMNFVSCEDLLEFAEKPKGRARGLESDEVRIMSKVLGKKPTPGQCLLTLEFIDWDIHKAIKLCKLQTILESYNLSLQECCDALQMYDWDLHTTALKLKSGGSSR